MALTKVTGQVIKNTTDVTVGVLTVTNTLAVGGTVSIGGTLTYEDVTNVDAVGLITARNGIVVGSGITLSKDGDIFATGVTTATTFVGNLTGNVTGTASANAVLTGSTNNTVCTVTGANAIQGESNLTFDGNLLKLQCDSGEFRVEAANGVDAFSVDSDNGNTIIGGSGTLTIPDTIVHAGDTDTKIRFSGADTITAETGGSSRFKIDSSGNVTIGNDGDSGSNPSSGYDELCIEGGNESIGMCFLSPAANEVDQTIAFGDSNNNKSGIIRYEHSNDAMHFDTGGSERLRITSGGNLLIGTATDSAQKLTLYGTNAALIMQNSATGTGSGNGFYLGNGVGTVGYLWNYENDEVRFATNDTERLRIKSTGTIESYSPDDTTPNIKWRSDDTNWFGSLNQSVEGATISTFLSTGGDWSANGTTYSATKAIASFETRAIALHPQFNNGAGKVAFLQKAAGSTTTDGTVTEILKIDNDGIKFGSDTAAVNALDDYEEGTYTPVFTAGTANITYTVQSGNYVKIGKLVRFDFYIQVNGGVSNGNMIEFNLPMNAAAATNSHRGSGVITYHNINNGNSGSNDFPALYIGTSSAQCYMGPTQWQAPSGTAQSNRYFIGGGTYHAA